jgi:hypothetical protein
MREGVPTSYGIGFRLFATKLICLSGHSNTEGNRQIGGQIYPVESHKSLLLVVVSLYSRDTRGGLIVLFLLTWKFVLTS